jgi:CRISPR/Cas system-associated endonuclease Cas1
MGEFQHPDGIWTWKTDAKSKSAMLWLPYLQEIKKGKGKGVWVLAYKGGEFQADLSHIDSLMLYGASGNLPLTFVDDLNTHKVPLVLHRRNMVAPCEFLPANTRDARDLLSFQIRARDNLIKRCHIARVLVRERLKSSAPDMPVPDAHWQALNKCRSIKAVRAWEAEHVKRFWAGYFSDLGDPMLARREDGPIQAALDAGSFFLFGVLLRWVLLHRLSPCHGFLHEPTDYPSLVYDLMEPYRYLMEQSVAGALRKRLALAPDSSISDPSFTKDLTEASLSNLKEMMEVTVHSQPTRQWVRRKNLMHGAVLALRAYLLGDMDRLVLPLEAPPKGGRPAKTTYKMPGQRADARHTPTSTKGGPKNDNAASGAALQE